MRRMWRQRCIAVSRGWVSPPPCLLNNFFKMPTLEEVDQYPLPEMMIPRLIKEQNMDEETASGVVREAKRMLFLSALGHRPISPSKIVDLGWHEMLMFTRFYKDFTDFIGRFVHHDPSPGRPGGGSWYETTKANYEKVFGEKPDPKYWP